jgi:hypothetical protein
MNVIGRHRRRDAINVCCLHRKFSFRDRGAAAAIGEASREREHRLLILAADTMKPISFASALWKLEQFRSQAQRSVCVCEQQPTGLRDALAVGHETTGDLLAIGNEFRTHGQRVVHAGFAALLVAGGRLAREGREYKTK